MPFNYLLTNLLVDVPSAVGAIFLDSEGEAIEWVSREGDPYELKVEGAYQSIFLRRLERVIDQLAAGEVDSYAVVSENLVALTQALPHGYYVVLVIDRRSGFHARAMYYLRRTAKVLSREL
jgi:hypothetical protein